MVARLVAVGILADEPGRVEDEAGVRGLLRLLEKCQQFRQRLVASAQRGDEAFGVLHHVPCPLPGVAFREVVAARRVVSERERAERRPPRPLRITAAHEARLGIEHVAPVARAFLEERRVLRVPEPRRHQARTPVVIGAFEEPRDGLALHDVVRVVAVRVEQVPVLLHPVGVPLAQRRADRLVRGLGVETPETLQIGVHDDGYGMGADHALVVLAHERPDRQEARRPLVRDHRRDHCVDLLGRDQRVEGIRCAVRVPERKRRVVLAALRHGHLAVRPAVAPVHVRDVVRLDERMVERRVEAHLLLVRPVDVRPREVMVPRGARRHADAVEPEVRDFLREIAACAVDVDGRIADPDMERRAVGEIEPEREPRRLFVRRRLRERFARGERTVELDHIRIEAIHPSPAARGADDAAVPLGARVARDDGRGEVPADAVLAVDEKPSLALRIRQPVDCAARRDRRLQFHAAVVERDGVVAGFGDLRLLAVRRRDLGLRLADERHDAEVPEIGTPRTVQMRLRKARDARVVPAVAGAVLPPLAPRVRPWLKESERIRRRHERVPVVGGADLGPHPLRVACGTTRVGRNCDEL